MRLVFCCCWVFYRILSSRVRKEPVSTQSSTDYMANMTNMHVERSAGHIALGNSGTRTFGRQLQWLNIQLSAKVGTPASISFLFILQKNNPLQVTNWNIWNIANFCAKILFTRMSLTCLVKNNYILNLKKQ